MVGEIDPNTVLDYATFQISSGQNRFEAFICCKGKTEKVASGHLDQLALRLPVANGFISDFNNSFKLQLSESVRCSSWFTKSTIVRFLDIVNVPEVLKSANSIQNELNQLEDTRRFHLTLYTKDNQAHLGGPGPDAGSLNDVTSVQKVKVETVSSDATKNELLRALDSRVLALNEELAATFRRALSANCTKSEISDLASFVEHFGASDLRNALYRYLSLDIHNHHADASDVQLKATHETRNCSERLIEDISSGSSKFDSQKTVINGISPAKIAQTERQTSSESEELSDSSEENHSFAERSRPVIRSASPRRSASPMRRIQIGRSGSRRATALTIKSLGCFPARERMVFNREADENNTADESFDQQPKGSENKVLRMSVQDKINLFESKQKDQTSDVHKRNTSTEASFGAKKSVLRRWSAGMGDSSTLYPQEDTFDCRDESTSNNLVVGPDKTSVEDTSEIIQCSSKLPENATVALSSEVQNMSLSPVNNPADSVECLLEEAQDRAAASAEWTRQKEAELNLMLMKMMESKPAKYTNQNQESNELKGDFYSQYKAKRDEKLRAENAGKRTEKEAKINVMREKLDRRKVEMTSKVSGVAGKLDSSLRSQKPRRNSSPPVVTKKETLNPVSARKASPKTPSAAPATRNSWSSIPSPRTAGTPPIKTSSGTSVSTIPNRRKTQPTPTSTRTGARTERPKQPKSAKGTLTESKPNLKCQEEEKPKTVTKTNKTVKTKTSTPAGDDSSVTPTKPSFYNKVTKKGSVVPLESKPFLKKGTGIGSGAGPLLSKSKLSKFDDSSKSSENVIQAEKESVAETVDTVTQSPDSPAEDSIQLASSADDVTRKDPVTADSIIENTEDLNPLVLIDEVENNVTHSAEPPVVEIQADEDMGIPSTAWVEVDHQEVPESFENDIPQITVHTDATATALSSPRVRHSLSQMLQAESTEPEIVEWGNAEIPPALVYQKDAPKGLKRLLKFARKSKGDSNVTGWSSPSVFSDGEEDAEELKAISKRNTDALSRKAALKAKVTGMQRTMLSESYDGGNSSKRSMDHSSNHENLSASMSGFPLGSHKLREGHISVTSTSTKAARSFFSLSTFRSSKSSEAKLR